MKIIIVGAGIMGSHLAKFLLKEDHEVSLIEHNEDVARSASDKLDAKIIVGNGADPDILNKVFVTEADLVLAVTASDEMNLVVCSIASFLGAKQQIARVRNTALNQLIANPAFETFSFDKIINPERVAAESIIKTVRSPGVSEIADFADGRILLRAFDVPKESPLCGLKIEDLRDKDFPWPFLVIVIIRKDKVIIPKGDSVIGPFDRIYVLLPIESLGEFLSFVNPSIKLPKKIIIYGASNISEIIAHALSKNIPEILFLEDDPDIAHDIATKLPFVQVINGSASESDILKECGIETTDVFIANSKNDHSNIISAVLAKKMGAKITAITTQQSDYMAIADALNIDTIINPQLAAVYQILSMVRGKSVKTVVKLTDCDVEALELIPEAGSAITKAPLRDIDFPSHSIIGAVCEGKEVSLADGNVLIKDGQRVIAFSQESSSKKLQDLFIKKKFF
ncbi:MAG TPA: Trk system potassium transporter TrkA [Candidatus Omnitrophota bacterium]|nr:Trk system potassium transporter TrkA [Candidatus Omnitrophota bacterium]